MIRYDPDDENAGTQTVNDIFPTCSADTLDGERLAQEPLSPCAYFRANVRDWGQKMSRFQGIYHLPLSRLAESSLPAMQPARRPIFIVFSQGFDNG
jgi:hypothetical protein